MADVTKSQSRPWLKFYPASYEAIFNETAPDPLTAFLAALERVPQRAAIRYFDGALSYSDLDRMSTALAAWLTRNGMKSGDRLGLILQNVPHFVISLLAAWKICAIAVPMNPMNRQRELALLFVDCKPAVILCHPDQADAVVNAIAEAGLLSTRLLVAAPHAFQTRDDRRVLPEPDIHCPGQAIDVATAIQQGAMLPKPALAARGEGPALIVYTSGTTGVPKGAVISHANVAYNARIYREWMALQDGVLVLGIAPLFHVTGLIGHIAAVFATAGSLVLTYRFSPDVVLEAIAEHQPHFTIGAITAFIALMNAPAANASAFGSLETIYSGGAPIPPSVVEEFARRFGRHVLPSYGLTETTSPSHLTPLGLEAPIDPVSGALSIGIPVYGADVQILDETGAVLPAGAMGEIAISGPMVIAEYWNRPDATAEAIKDGWLLTGDIAIMDAQGWFYLVDRKKDMINAAGFKVWPREIEDVLHTHPAVREVAVVGVPDPYRGETVKAVVSLKMGIATTVAELDAFCRSRMAAYKAPRHFEIVDELPKTVTGKILRRALR